MRAEGQQGQPLERTESQPLRFISGDWFRQNYPMAHQKWKQAESLLGAEDSDQNLSAIGHYVRESLQEFADVLVRRLKVPNVEPDKAKTINRIRAAIDHAGLNIGTTVRPFLDALVGYWIALNNLVQRQEHAGQREAAPLTLADAHRIVFHSAALMAELHNSLSRK